jgi:hypothetical protein
MDRLRPSQEYTQGAMADKKQFSKTKSIVKVETGIITLISYHQYLKIVDWCSVYLTPQALPKYIYLSPPLIFPTFKGTEGYVIVSRENVNR